MLKQEKNPKLIALLVSEIEKYFYPREIDYCLKNYNEVYFLYVNWFVIRCTTIEKKIIFSEIAN